MLGARILKTLLGTPLHRRRKKSLVAGHRGLLGERGEHPFLLLGCMCLFEYGRRSRNTQTTTRMEGASVRWQGTVRKDTVVFNIFLRECQNLSHIFASLHPAFHENYVGLFSSFFFSVRDHLLSHMRTDERSQDCPMYSKFIPTESRVVFSYLSEMMRYGEIPLVRGNVSEPLKMDVVQN